MNKQIMCINNTGIEKYIHKYMVYVYDYDMVYDNEPVYVLKDNFDNTHYLKKDRFAGALYNCPLLIYIEQLKKLIPTGF